MDAQAKWTPGPWGVRQGTSAGKEVWAPDALKSRQRVGSFGGKDRDANAAISAAAPDLYEALTASQKAIRELRDQGAPTAFWDDIETANRAALSKARATPDASSEKEARS